MREEELMRSQVFCLSVGLLLFWVVLLRDETLHQGPVLWFGGFVFFLVALMLLGLRQWKQR